jgi:hypothetical protein
MEKKKLNISDTKQPTRRQRRNAINIERREEEEENINIF